MIYIADVVLAFILDLIFGDPQKVPHPVRFIGSLIKLTENYLRNAFIQRSANKEKAEYICGFILCGFVTAVVFFVVLLILMAARYFNVILFHVLNTYIIYTSIASRCLGDEALKVYRKLQTGTLEEARISLSYLVGRDTSNLSEEGVIKGVIETTAENTVDAVISPLIYAIAGSIIGIGAPLVYAFKAVSTLDSMVGYKNDKYRYLGTASARMDDILNFIPARISILIISAAAYLLGMSGRQALKTSLRDRKKHLSPNSAHSESTVAGALGIRLGGPNVYFGKVVDKPYLGDQTKTIDRDDILKTIKLMYVSSGLTISLLFLVVLFLFYIF